MTAEALLFEAVGRRDAGRPTEARALAAAALEAADDAGRTVEALLLVGRTSIDLGEYEQAERALDEAVALAETLDGEAAPTLRVLALADRAALARTLGRYDEAGARYRHVLDQAEPDSLDGATVANDLAVTLKFAGKLDEAERPTAARSRPTSASWAPTIPDLATALHRRALAILDGAVEPDHPTLLASRENLAALDEKEEPAEAGSPVATSA